MESTDNHAQSRPDALAGAVVLLCGTARHESSSNLADVPAVASTLTDLSHVLTDRCGASRVTIKLNPPTLTELGDALSLAARRADDVLLVYYLGHGLVSPEGELYLAAGQTDSRAHRLAHTALPYQTLRRYVIESPARAKIVILDCCFSGRAIGQLGAPEQMMDLAAIDGVFVLTSAGREEVALAPPGAKHTAFSGTLIKLLTEGDPRAGRELTLDEVYRYLSWALPAAGYPKPRRRATGRIDELVLTQNLAYADQPPTKTSPPLPPPPVGTLAAWIAAAAGTATVPFLTSAVHGGGWHQLPFGVRGGLLTSGWGLALLAATGLLAVVTTNRLVNHVTRLLAWGRRRRLRRALAAVPAFLLAAWVGVSAVEAGGAGRVWLDTCPPADQLRVLTTPEGYEPTRQLARAFELHTARGNFDCPEIRALVYAEAPARVTSAFHRGWGDDDRVQIGPRPDVWLPDAATEVHAAKALAGAALPVAQDGIRTVATTPLVLAVPADQLASGPGQGQQVTGESWPKLFDTLKRLKWNVIAPNPGTATGDLARVALYSAAKGDAERSVAPISPQTIERYVEGSYDRTGYLPGANQTQLLCQLRGTAPADRKDRAFILTEQSLARFNQGAALGATCGATSQVAESERLTALYPVATPVLDRPFVRMNWDSMTERQHAAAQRFGDWFGTLDGKQALNDIGLRPPDLPVRAPLSGEFGVWREATYREVAVDDALDTIRATYANVHRPGRILLALDASGSMGAEGPDGRRLWTVAVQGVTDSMGLMGPRDEFGAWAFHGSGADGVRRLVPIGRRDQPAQGRPRLEATRDALAAVKPNGPAPLHAAVVAGVKQVGPTTKDRVTALVILTDGEGDNASDIDVGQLESAVKDKNVRVFALAVGTTSCRASTLARITSRTGGFCLEAESATMRAQISVIFDALWDAGPARAQAETK